MLAEVRQQVYSPAATACIELLWIFIQLNLWKVGMLNAHVILRLIYLALSGSSIDFFWKHGTIAFEMTRYLWRSIKTQYTRYQYFHLFSTYEIQYMRNIQISFYLVMTNCSPSSIVFVQWLVHCHSYVFICIAKPFGWCAHASCNLPLESYRSFSNHE